MGPGAYIFRLDCLKSAAVEFFSIHPPCICVVSLHSIIPISIVFLISIHYSSGFKGIMNNDSMQIMRQGAFRRSNRVLLTGLSQTHAPRFYRLEMHCSPEPVIELTSPVICHHPAILSTQSVDLTGTHEVGECDVLSHLETSFYFAFSEIGVFFRDFRFHYGLCSALQSVENIAV